MVKSKDKYEKIIDSAIREFIKTTGGYLNEDDYQKYSEKILTKYSNMIKEVKDG